MNIFKALSEGNGRISETNVTSFMSYLLDSTNELKNSFFVLFAHLVDSEISENKICDSLKINQKTIREQILYFSSEYVVASEPEYKIQKEDGTKQIPDILLRISSKATGEDIAFIIIENKINKAAIKKGQLEKQFDYFKNSDDYDESKLVFSVLITPDEDIFKKLYESVEKRIKATWLRWINYKDNNKSIEAVLRELIKYEQDAEIEPIDPNTQFIIKSFIDYIATEFSGNENGRKNFSYYGFDVVGEASASVGNKNYLIKRFSNNMIRLFDEQEKLLNIEVKPILRKINDEYHFEINLYHSTGKAKNTQILGREIINKLNDNN